MSIRSFFIEPIEHVLAKGRPTLIKWQRFFEPFWVFMCGRCHLTRDTEQSIREAGFAFDEIERVFATGAAPVVSPTIKGIARKGGHSEVAPTTSR